MKGFILGLTISFLTLYSFNFLPSKEKNFKEQLDLYIGKYCFHLHHWITTFILIMVLVLGKYSDNDIFRLSLGVLVGICFEDFLFRDIFKIRRCGVMS